VIEAALKFDPLLLVDITAVSSESQSYFDLCYGPHSNIQIPRELPATAFGATFAATENAARRSWDVRPYRSSIWWASRRHWYQI